MNLAKLPVISIAPQLCRLPGVAAFWGKVPVEGQGGGEGEATGGPLHPYPAGPRGRAIPGSSPGQALPRDARD